MKNITIGDVVTTTRHEHKMCVGAVNGDEIFCQYFIELELHEETNLLSELTKVDI